MTAKEYLSQAFQLDQRINSKLEQIASLNALATKCTSTLSGMPRNPNRGGSATSDIIAKIVDLQTEINSDIDRLVDLKQELVGAIKSVDDTEYRILLELRYLCFKTWEQIAVEMNCQVRNIYTLHNKALKQVAVPKS